MGHIKLELTIDETNVILNALGQLSYIKVVDLIQKIQQQGAFQLKDIDKGDTMEEEKYIEETIQQ
ncbi:hypothetical protein [Aquimarina celericrescens]|uniref:Uncharacterized protein n=1 Tax=Aquimarina celericrescens TaxID=1964542 RepID=A0ABW5B1A6_9FLAO|nr:hypothetical protein [Aquimarina celericrescens]